MPLIQSLKTGTLKLLRQTLIATGILFSLFSSNRKNEPLTVEEIKDKIKDKENPRILILGASFGGIKLTIELNRFAELNSCQIIVIDQKDYFEYTPGILRSIVNGKLGEVSGPLPSSFDFIKGQVETVNTSYVVVNVYDQQKNCFEKISLDFDYLVIATGTAYGRSDASHSPYSKFIKTINTSGEKTIESRKSEIIRFKSDADNANTVLVVGAGLVGVELAAELAENGKKVFLADRGDDVCKALPFKCRNFVRQHLQSLGVDVILSCDILKMDESSCQYKFNGSDKEKEESGSLHNLAYDILIECIGTEPNTKFLTNSETMQSCLDDRNRITVNDQLNVVIDKEKSPVNNIFALGDVCYHSNSAQFSGCVLYAKLQALFIAQSLRRKIISSTLTEKHSFPSSLTGHTTIPVIVAVSLGKTCGSLVYEDIVLNGFLAAISKVAIQETTVLEMTGNPFANYFWYLTNEILLFFYKKTKGWFY